MLDGDLKILIQCVGFITTKHVPRRRLLNHAELPSWNGSCAIQRGKCHIRLFIWCFVWRLPDPVFSFGEVLQRDANWLPKEKTQPVNLCHKQTESSSGSRISWWCSYRVANHMIAVGYERASKKSGMKFKIQGQCSLRAGMIKSYLDFCALGSHVGQERCPVELLHLSDMDKSRASQRGPKTLPLPRQVKEQWFVG